MSDIYTHRDYSFDDEAMSFALHMDRMTAEKLPGEKNERT